MIHRTKQMTGSKSNIIFEVPTRLHREGKKSGWKKTSSSVFSGHVAKTWRRRRQCRTEARTRAIAVQGITWKRSWETDIWPSVWDRIKRKTCSQKRSWATILSCVWKVLPLWTIGMFQMVNGDSCPDIRTRPIWKITMTHHVRGCSFRIVFPRTQGCKFDSDQHVWKYVENSQLCTECI